jgi:hypothetical protein
VSQPRDDRRSICLIHLWKIINIRHPLVRLATEIDWEFLAGRFSSVYSFGPGHAPLPTRLWWLGCLSSSTWTTSPMRRGVTAGWRIRISNTCAREVVVKHAAPLESLTAAAG